jgi:glucosamine-6-phosphate isomerase
MIKKPEIHQNYSELCQAVAQRVLLCIQKKPNALICLGSGDTPLGVFDILVQKANNASIDFSAVHFVGLDEWLGMNQHDVGSCFYTMYQKLFIPLNLKAQQIHCFDAKAENLPAECSKIDGLIEANGGLDFILLGIGTNGHLAMNEPGTAFDQTSHISVLAQSTIDVGQKYFNQNTPLTKGITLGMKQIASSKEIVLMANGTKKQAIIQELLHTTQANTNLPASMLLALPQASILLDTTAVGDL